MELQYAQQAVSLLFCALFHSLTLLIPFGIPKKDTASQLLPNFVPIDWTVLLGMDLRTKTCVLIPSWWQGNGTSLGSKTIRKLYDIGGLLLCMSWSALRVHITHPITSITCDKKRHLPVINRLQIMASLRRWCSICIAKTNRNEFLHCQNREKEIERGRREQRVTSRSA